MQRRPFVKLGLRRLARKHPDRRDEIKQVLRDDDLLDAVVEESAVVAASVYGIGDGGRLLDFLDWFIENSDAIFAIISKLLLLFGDDD